MSVKVCVSRASKRWNAGLPLFDWSTATKDGLKRNLDSTSSRRFAAMLTQAFRMEVSSILLSGERGCAGEER